MQANTPMNNYVTITPTNTSSTNTLASVIPTSPPVVLKKTQSKEFMELVRAIMNKNQNKFDQYLKKVLKTNELNCVTDIQGKSPQDGYFKSVSLPYLAAFYDYPFFLKALLENGADANYTYPANQCTLLHLAAQNGWLDILTLLIDKQASMNVLAAEGRTPLFLAAKNGHVECVKKLCSMGADLLLVDKPENLFTPLIIAISQGHQKIVLTLIINMKIRGIQQYKQELLRASRACIEFAHPELLPLITPTIEHEWPNTSSPEKDVNSILHAAAEKGIAQTVESVIQQNANVNGLSTASNAGIQYPPLYIAAQNGHDAVVKILLHRGANPLLGTSVGELPILAALWNKHINVLVTLCTDSRVDINKPLLISLNHPRFKSQENAEILSKIQLGYRFPSNVNGTMELTPLHFAVVFIKDNLAVITKLFELGAVANKHCYDRSILKIAVFAHSSEEVLKLLLRHGAKPSNSDLNLNSLILIAIASLNIVAVKVLCEVLFKREDKNNFLKNMLLFSYCFNNKEAAEYLISIGADSSMTCPDFQQQTIEDWLGIDLPVSNVITEEPTSIENIEKPVVVKEPIVSLSKPGAKPKSTEKPSAFTAPTFISEVQMSMGSRKYLRDELKMPDTEIDAMIALNKKYKKEQPRSQGLMFQAAKPAAVIHFTWCNGKVASENLMKIEGNSAPNCFYLFPEDSFLEEQGCTSELVKKFKGVRPVFDAAHIKKLDDNISEFITEFYFNNVQCFLAATHELKISDTDRLLVFPLAADNNQEAKLFLPLVFVAQGFHTRADIKSQSNSTKAYRISVSKGQISGVNEALLSAISLSNK